MPVAGAYVTNHSATRQPDREIYLDSIGKIEDDDCQLWTGTLGRANASKQ